MLPAWRRLESLLAPTHEDDIGVVVVVGAAVIVIQRLDAVVVAEDEVLRYLGYSRAGLLVRAHRERLPIPAVKWPVIPGLTAGVKDEIAVEPVPPAKAIVDVHARAGPPEEHVVVDMGFAGLGYKVHGGLFFECPELVDQIVRYLGVDWVVVVGEHAPRAVGTELVGAAPRRDCGVAGPADVAAGDGGVQVVPADHDRVAVVPLHRDARHGDPTRAVEKDRARTLQAWGGTMGGGEGMREQKNNRRTTPHCYFLAIRIHIEGRGQKEQMRQPKVTSAPSCPNHHQTVRHAGPCRSHGRPETRCLRQ